MDSGYEAMLSCIRSDRTPNLLVLQYSALWRIENLLFVPRYFFTESAIERRSPLATTARRAGWVGCNILLCQIPEEGKIGIVTAGAERAKELVRRRYREVESLRNVPVSTRGWSLDVLNAVRQLKRERFSLAEAYSFEQQLNALHPGNHNVRAKIRQQLQVLRDLHFLKFLGKGQYEFVSTT